MKIFIFQVLKRLETLPKITIKTHFKSISPKNTISYFSILQAIFQNLKMFHKFCQIPNIFSKTFFKLKTIPKIIMKQTRKHYYKLIEFYV